MFLPDTFTISDNLLKDKVIVVTGAGDGIGKEAALTFAKLGATVILMGRTIAKLEMVYDEIEAAGNHEAAIYPINFEGAVEKDYEDMYLKLNEEYQRLDGLLINAAELGARTPISNYDTEAWYKLMQVNLHSPFMMIKALTPLLEAAENASVVTTTSSVAEKGRAYWGAYSVSKSALRNLTEILADEWEGTNNVRINSINPGATRTSMRAMAYPAENPETVVPAQKHMPLYTYLMSDESTDVNGVHFDAKKLA
ncbi:YciK family oxidoreductase [Sessilibacter corallicola]|uniref:YciK family oxidoreductase n=1 Tax=Sessilibacter corallicola TaxID=2904075 RepID=UPI001E417CF2|nr:YciK family oxidoreductase [Sessilibacter corallicola]MCE2029361.1 YciK family oxidoreductase [Sessilibacter corallicola]